MPTPRSFRLTFGLLVLLMAAPAGAGPFEVTDSEGFGAPMTATTIDLPEGWTGQGRVAWSKPCSGNEFYEIVFSARSADGQSGMRIMPGHFISWNDVVVDGVTDPALAQMAVAQAEAARNDLRTQFRNSNCHVAWAGGTQDLIDRLVLPKRPAGARVTAIRPDEPQRAAFAKGIGAAGPSGGKTYYDAVIVELTYPGAQGPLAEQLLLSWYMFTDDPAQRLPGFPAFTMQATYVEPLRFVWAPAAQAAGLPKALAALQGARVNADWVAKVREVQAERYRKRAAEQAEAEKSRQEANRRRQDDLDRQHKAFLDMIKG